jgi:hypothetical protein
MIQIQSLTPEQQEAYDVMEAARVNVDAVAARGEAFLNANPSVSKPVIVALKEEWRIAVNSFDDARHEFFRLMGPEWCAKNDVS